MAEDQFQWINQHPPYAYGQWQPPLAIADTTFAKRRVFFEKHPAHCNGKTVCPACGYPTINRRRNFDYCGLCHWEDDGQDDPWADQFNGGPNDSSLSEARINFATSYCRWSFNDKNDFNASAQQRLFSERAQQAKRILCEHYNGLMALENKTAIAQQWQKIEAAIKQLP